MNINDMKNINEQTEKNKLADTILLLTSGLIFTWGIVCCILNNMHHEPIYGRTFLHITVILTALRIVFINRYTAVFSLITGFVTSIFIYISIFTDPYIEELSKDALVFLKDVFLYIGGYIQYNSEYELVINLGLCIIISMFVFIFITVSFQSSALIGLASVTFGVIFSSGGSVYSFGFLACMSGVLVFLIKYLHMRGFKKISQTQKYFKEKQKQNKISSLLFISVIAFLCAGAAYIIPAPDTGFKDIVADTILFRPLKAANKLLTSFFAPKYFSLTSTGYLGKDRRLGGDAMLNDDIVMEVRAKGRERIYLTGNISDTYTGYSWENTSRENQTYLFSDDTPEINFIELMFSNLMISLDTGEFDPLCGILENPEKIFDSWYAQRCEYIDGGTMTIQMQQSVYTPRAVEIDIKDKRTFSLFSHPMIVDITKDEISQSVLKDVHGNLSVKKLMPQNTVYKIHYRFNPAVSYWESIKTYSRKGVYTEIRDALGELHKKYNFNKNQIFISPDESLDEDKSNLHMFKMYPEGEMHYSSEALMSYEDILTDILIPRAEEIYSRYTALPENFPKRVGELAGDITEGAENDYRKAVKIMNYLKSRYPYTLTPGDIPEDRDFVDYFLFDGQKGYCTYFASAFVTMCRSIGLPARYAEGYVTPPEKNEDDIYVITNKEGHAWGEVYFEGYGWIQFEPTPSADSDGTPHMLPSSEQYLPDEPEMNASPNTSTGISDHTQSFLIEENDVNTDINTLNTETYTPVHNPTPPEIIFSNLAAAVTLISAVFILYMTLRVIHRRLSEKKILGKTNREAVILYFYILMKYLRLFGCKKLENETVSQYIGRYRIEDKLPHISEAAEVFSKACYSGAEITVNERSILICAIKEIDDTVLQSVGKAKYLYYKYISGII